MLIKTLEGKVVGVYEDGIYTKKVKGSTHMLRTPLGWSNDCNICDNLVALGCKEIKIIDKEDNSIYSVSMQEFMDKAIYINRGFGEQLVLPLRYWAVKRP